MKRFPFDIDDDPLAAPEMPSGQLMPDELADLLLRLLPVLNPADHTPFHHDTDPIGTRMEHDLPPELAGLPHKGGIADDPHGA